MKINSKNLGLVTKKFNDFFLVDLINKENLGNDTSDKKLECLLNELSNAEEEACESCSI